MNIGTRIERLEAECAPPDEGPLEVISRRPIWDVGPSGSMLTGRVIITRHEDGELVAQEVTP